MPIIILNLGIHALSFIQILHVLVLNVLALCDASETMSLMFFVNRPHVYVESIHLSALGSMGFDGFDQ